MTTPDNPSEASEHRKSEPIMELAEWYRRQAAALSHRASDIALGDPLKAETRKARLYLLGVSMISITIVYTGLVPQEITTLGITFGEADRRSLLGILSVVTAYFLVSFVIYGVSDYLAWRSAYKAAFLDELDARADLDENLRKHQTYSGFYPSVSWARSLFEFVLPLIVGLYAIYTLVDG